MRERYIAPSSYIAARKLGGEMVIMSAETSHLFILNAVGTALWEAADGRTPLAEIVKRVVCVHFDIDFGTAQQDVEEFVEALSEHKILVVSDRPIELRRTLTENLPTQPQES